MSIAYVKLNRSETAKEWISDQPEKISLTNASNCWNIDGECASGVSKIAFILRAKSSSPSWTTKDFNIKSTAVISNSRCQTRQLNAD